MATKKTSIKPATSKADVNKSSSSNTLYFSKEVLVRDVRKAVKQLETYLGPLNAVYDNVDANNWKSVILDSYKDIVVDDEFIIRCMKSSDKSQKQKNKTYKTEIVLTPGVRNLVGADTMRHRTMQQL